MIYCTDMDGNCNCRTVVCIKYYTTYTLNISSSMLHIYIYVPVPITGGNKFLEIIIFSLEKCSVNSISRI